MAKIVRRICVVLFLLGALAGTTSAQKRLTAAEAKEHFGEVATVCGEVVSTRFASTSRGEPTFLNLDRPFPNQVFTVVIWGNNRNKFGNPEDAFKGKHICVSGKITAYDGLPEIIAEESGQIKIDTGK